jgi:hypothetical protein
VIQIAIGELDSGIQVLRPMVPSGDMNPEKLERDGKYTLNIFFFIGELKSLQILRFK